MRRVQMLALRRKLEVDVRQIVADVSGEGSVGEGRAVGGETGAIVKVLDFFPVIEKYKYKYPHTIIYMYFAEINYKITCRFRISDTDRARPRTRCRNPE